MSLSRRDFLQILGLSAVGAATSSALLGVDAMLPPTHLETVRGRVLEPTTTTHGDTIWADTLVDISGINGNRYQTSAGELPVTAVQPISPLIAEQRHASVPFDARVIGAVAVVRAYCDPTAPLVTRIGHGGVMCVTDQMHYGRTGDWYEVCDVQGESLGWTQATQWGPVRDRTVSTLHVTINRAKHTLTFPDGTATAVNLPADLTNGQMNIRRVAVGGGEIANGGRTYHGVPHLLHLDSGTPMHGVYWHNDFGHSAARIEVNTLVAGVLWDAHKIHVTII